MVWLQCYLRHRDLYSYSSMSCWHVCGYPDTALHFGGLQHNRFAFLVISHNGTDLNAFSQNITLPQIKDERVISHQNAHDMVAIWKWWKKGFPGNPIKTEGHDWLMKIAIPQKPFKLQPYQYRVFREEMIIALSSVIILNCIDSRSRQEVRWMAILEWMQRVLWLRICQKRAILSNWRM